MSQMMKSVSSSRFSVIRIVLACAMSVLMADPTLPQAAAQTTFATPEAAAAALVQAVRSGQKTQEFAILGPDLKTEIATLDPAEVAFDREAFLAAAKQEVPLFVWVDVL